MNRIEVSTFGWSLQATLGHAQKTEDGSSVSVTSHAHPHNAYLVKPVHLPDPATKVVLDAVVRVYSSTKSLSVQAGIDAHAKGVPGEWSSWTPRTQDGTFRIHHEISERTDSIVIWLHSVGEWAANTHQSVWSEIYISYESSTGPEPEPEPEPEPDTGIAGQLARIEKEIEEIVQQATEATRKVNQLVEEWDKAQEWVNEYNKYIGQ